VEITYPYARTNVYFSRFGFGFEANAIGKAQARIVRDLKKYIVGRKLEPSQNKMIKSLLYKIVTSCCTGWIYDTKASGDNANFSPDTYNGDGCTQAFKFQTALLYCYVCRELLLCIVKPTRIY
jgi:hypothetical protein